MKKNIIKKGDRFYMREVIEEIESIYCNGKKRRVFLCKCDCGNIEKVKIESLLYYGSKSCGCLRVEKNRKLRTTHGMSRSKIYYIWSSILDRCNNKKCSRYKDYGGRGIDVCKKWCKFDGFIEDMKDGYMEGSQIDRIDNNKGYSKENCRWVTAKENQNNRRNNRVVEFNGVIKTLSQWAVYLGIKRSTLSSRINKQKWSIQKSFTK